MADRGPLAGKNALVTGGGVRLGRAIALHLGSLGAHLVVHHHRSAKGAKEVCQAIEAAGGTASAVTADLSDPAQAKGLVAAAKRAADGPIDLLVNNASDFPVAKLEDLDWDGLERTLRLDAWAPFELARAFARQVPDGKVPDGKVPDGKTARSSRSTRPGVGGAVVNLLDARIADYDWQHAGYHLAKRMLEDMTQLLAVRLAPRVTVNAVAPGPILPPPGGGEAVLRKWARHLPLGRTPGPEAVAEAVAYLLVAQGVTGQVLFVDGGRHLGRAVYA